MSSPQANAAARSLIDALHDPVALTEALCNIESVSGNETAIADAVEATLRHIGAAATPLEVLRDGDTVVARTDLGLPERVVIAGHLDTVPIEENFPPERRLVDGREAVWGRGACDMKAGVAMQLATAAALTSPNRDVTWVFYDHEEVDSALNGLGRVSRNHPDWLDGDFAVLGEPTNAAIEGGCNGTLRVELRTRGVRAHSARAWKGINAIHGAAEVLTTLSNHRAEAKEVDGLKFQESLSAVAISGGVAGNVIPDECTVTINYRFAPSQSAEQATEYLRSLFPGLDMVVTDSAEGARPGLDQPAAAEFIAAIGGTPSAKLGWTDVARFASLGIPAVNFGPGDALFAHKADEHAPIDDIIGATSALKNWLTASAGAQQR